jgi:iron complex outermembrane recepter protein
LTPKNLKQLPALFCAFALFASGQSAVPDLTELSLDELSNIKITSFTKKQQKLSQVAGAVYVITQEQIIRSGLTSVPELLRLAPGLEVARLNGTQWSVSARGFGGEFANKLLVLIDGRSIYTPTFSGVYWDVGMPLLEDIDRIEVIRGPGATVWGANAVLGVIDIITKSTAESKGTLLTAAAGTAERAFGGARIGGADGNTGYRVSVSGYDHSQLQTAGGQGANDGWQSVQGEFRLDGSAHGNRDTWMLEGDLFRGFENTNAINPSITAQAFVSSPSSFDTTSGSLTGEWRRRVSETSEFRVQSYFDYLNRPEPQASKVASRTGDLELQYDFVAGKRNNLSLGAGDRIINLDIDTQQLYTFGRGNLTYDNVNGFAQDEIHFLNDRLLFTAGAKIEHNHFGGWAFEPSANLVWIPNKHHSLWTSVARAVRTPTLFETTVDAPVALIPGSSQTYDLPVLVSVFGSRTFGNELVNDFEAGYRQELSNKVSLDIDLFYDRFSNLRAFSPGALSLVPGQDPYILYSEIFSNSYRGRGKGAEATVTWQVFRDWKLASSYSYNILSTQPNSSAPPGTADGSGQDPARDKVKIQSYWNVSKAVQLDTFLYSNSAEAASTTYLNLNIPAYMRLDVRLGYRINSHWQLSVAGQNLLEPRHLEGVPELLSGYSYVDRGVYLKSTWKF